MISLSEKDVTDRLLLRVIEWGKKSGHNVRIHKNCDYSGAGEWQIWLFDNNCLEGMYVNEKNKNKDFDESIKKEKIAAAKAQLLHAQKILAEAGE